MDAHTKSHQQPIHTTDNGHSRRPRNYRPTAADYQHYETIKAALFDELEQLGQRLIQRHMPAQLMVFDDPNEWPASAAAAHLSATLRSLVDQTAGWTQHRWQIEQLTDECIHGTRALARRANIAVSRCRDAGHGTLNDGDMMRLLLSLHTALGVDCYELDRIAFEREELKRFAQERRLDNKRG